MAGQHLFRTMNHNTFLEIDREQAAIISGIFVLEHLSTKYSSQAHNAQIQDVINKLQREGCKVSNLKRQASIHVMQVDDDQLRGEKAKKAKKPKNEEVILFGDDLIRQIDPNHINEEESKSELSMDIQRKQVQ